MPGAILALWVMVIGASSFIVGRSLDAGGPDCAAETACERDSATRSARTQLLDNSVLRKLLFGMRDVTIFILPKMWDST